MARGLIGACGFSVLFGLVCQSAQAGDRKSTGGVQESKRAVLIAISSETTGASASRPLALSYSVDRRSGSGKDEELAARTHEHKTLTLFRFNSNFGEVAVQPVIGHVNGAQFSVGF